MWIVATTSAAYIGVSNDVGDFLNKLAWFWGIVAGISFYLGIAYPAIGTHIGHPYFGAWRGIFWTRGGLGSFIVFANMVFLFQAVRFMKQPVLLIVNSIFYLLTLALVILTKSATAVILLVVTTQNGDTQVHTSDTTLIEKYTMVNLGDLNVGERVVVVGSSNDDGSVTARSIQSMRNFQAAPPNAP